MALQSLERQKIKTALEQRLNPLFHGVSQASHGAKNYQKNSLVIDIATQSFEVLARDPRSYAVETTIGLEILVFEHLDLSAEMDLAIDKVIGAIEKDRTLGGVFEDIALSLVETSVDETTERKIGFARIEFVGRQVLEAQTLEKIQDDFKGLILAHI